MVGAEIGAANPACKLEVALSHNLVDFDQGLIDFAQKYIAVQAEAMYEELGDEFVEDELALERLAAELEIEPDDKRLRLVGLATISCLQRRYLGACGLDSCRGKERVDEMIRQVLA